MPTNEELFEAIRTLRDYCKGRKDCYGDTDADDCPLADWCRRNLIPDDAPCEWKDPEVCG